MENLLKKKNELSSPSRLLIAFVLVVLIVPILAGCSTQTKLEEYKSDIAKVKLPMLPGWVVDAEQAESQDVAYLTLKNDYSGVLITRSPLSQIFPDLQPGAEFGDLFNNLISLGEGVFTASGPVDIQQKKGYQQAVVPIDLAQVVNIAGTSKGTLLMALKGDQAVIAIFFCTEEKSDVCEKDLARSIKGFTLIE